MNVEHEVTLLIEEIRRLGSKNADGKISVKFGVLFNDDQCANLFEALVGTLKAAKRKKIISFEGELLLQGVHDNVDVILLQDWVWQSFLNLSEKVQMFLTCHCYILIWKYTWECNIFVYFIGIFLYSNFSFSQGSDLHTRLFWKVAIFPVQTAISLKYILTVIVVCMIMLLCFWDFEWIQFCLHS